MKQLAETWKMSEFGVFGEKKITNFIYESKFSTQGVKYGVKYVQS